MEFSDFIPLQDQYEVSKARATLAVQAELLLRSTEVVCDIILSRFNDIYEEE
jgi:hypothetical protein